jgi:hypothetical protein
VVTSDFAAAHVAAVRARIATAYQNIGTAMRDTPPNPATRGRTRAVCGFWNADADWANNTALPTIDRTVFGATADSGLSNVRTLEVRYSGWEAPRCWNGGSPAAGRAPRAASDCSTASPA